MTPPPTPPRVRKPPVAARCVVHHHTVKAWKNADDSVGWYDHESPNTGCRIIASTPDGLRQVSRGKAPERNTA